MSAKLTEEASPEADPSRNIKKSCTEASIKAERVLIHLF